MTVGVKYAVAVAWRGRHWWGLDVHGWRVFAGLANGGLAWDMLATLLQKGDCAVFRPGNEAALVEAARGVAVYHARDLWVVLDRRYCAADGADAVLIGDLADAVRECVLAARTFQELNGPKWQGDLEVGPDGDLVVKR